MSLRTLYQSLLDSDLARQRVIARLWSIPLTTNRRADIAAELAASMASGEAVLRAREALPPEALAALEALQRHEGEIGWAAFTRRWGEIRPVGPGRLEREALWEHPISPAETLWYYGFLYRATVIDEQGVSHEVAYIPPDLMLYLPPPPPLVLPEPPTTAPPLHPVAVGDALADRLAVLWGQIQQVSAPLRGGNLPAPLLQRLRRRLGLPASQVEMLITLSLEQGWLQVDERNLLRPDPRQALEWLRGERAEQWAALFTAWKESRRWNDLAALPTLRPAEGTRWPNDPLQTRAALLDLLRPLTPSVWYDLPAFVAHVHEHNTDFLRPDGDYDRWALHELHSGAPLRGFDHWMEVEGAFLVHALLFPLHHLGLVDVGPRWEGLPPDRFRLTEAGTQLLQGEIPPLEAPPPFEVSGEGTIRVPPGRRYELFQLHRIADWRDDDLYTYRLTPASLTRARRQRIEIGRILAFLEEGGAKPLSAPLKAALERAYRRGSELRLVHGWLVQSKEDAPLQEDAVRPFLRERLGRRAALFDERDTARIRRAFIGLGLLPDVKED